MHAAKAQSNRVSVLVFIYNLQLSKREELSVLLLLLHFRLDFLAPARGKSERLITRRFITLSDPCVCVCVCCVPVFFYFRVQQIQSVPMS